MDYLLIETKYFFYPLWCVGEGVIGSSVGVGFIVGAIEEWSVGTAVVLEVLGDGVDDLEVVGVVTVGVSVDRVDGFDPKKKTINLNRKILYRCSVKGN